MDTEQGRKCLLEVAGILTSWGCPFFLIQGTALGAYRDKGFTPTERDIDLGILQERLNPIATNLLGHLIWAGFDTECFVIPFTHPRTLVAYKYGVKVDLVGLTRWKDKRFTATPVRPWIAEPYAIVHDAVMLETYQPVELFGRTFNVPSPIETYLELEYGADWRTPREDHVSRTRIYDYLTKEGIPLDYLEQQPATS